MQRNVASWESSSCASPEHLFRNPVHMDVAFQTVRPLQHGLGTWVAGRYFKPCFSTGHSSAGSRTFRPFSGSSSRSARIVPSATWRPDQINQICIVGGGNAAQVLAALLGHARETSTSAAKVAVLAPFGDECQRLSDAAVGNGGILVENPDGTTFKGMPDIITNDPKKALKGSQIVLLPLPVFAVRPMLELIAPYVEHATWVGALPAQGGFQWLAGKVLDTSPDGKDIKLFGLDKLPYNCRSLEYGKRVKVYGYKQDLGLACVPSQASLASSMATTISAVIPKLNLYSVPHFLAITMATSNQCIHPARMYGLFSENTSTTRIPLFYEEMDEYSADLIGKVSDEMLGIARALERSAEHLGYELDLSAVLPVDEALKRVYEIEDMSSLARMFATSVGLKGISTPLKKVDTSDGSELYEVDWNCRYFVEDIPALCVLRGLAQIAGVHVPSIDMLIRWAQCNLTDGYKFLRDDGKLNDDRKRFMYTPQYYGISTMEDLLDFHLGVIS